jgi:hypothetical protein
MMDILKAHVEVHAVTLERILWGHVIRLLEILEDVPRRCAMRTRLKRWFQWCWYGKAGGRARRFTESASSVPTLLEVQQAALAY